MLNGVRSTRKPWVRQKKQKKEVKKEEPSDTHSQDDGDSSGSGTEMKELNT